MPIIGPSMKQTAFNDGRLHCDAVIGRGSKKLMELSWEKWVEGRKESEGD
jgi:hypothetical protein